jgi:RNA polymerase sigma-70 factor, ECF subfamily
MSTERAISVGCIICSPRLPSAIRNPTPTENDMTQDPQEITQLLLAWSEGDKEAFDRLTPLIYSELHRLAKSYMRRERAQQTLQTTALIHEAYLRLIDADSVQWQSRAHFFGVAARVMRRILVTIARERGSQKRGAGALAVSLDEGMLISEQSMEDFIALDEALNALAQFDERKAKVVELRFFGGLTEAETATSLNISIESVTRDWRLARSWLRRMLSGESSV